MEPQGTMTTACKIVLNLTFIQAPMSLIIVVQILPKKPPVRLLAGDEATSTCKAPKREADLASEQAAATPKEPRLT